MYTRETRLDKSLSLVRNPLLFRNKCHLSRHKCHLIPDFRSFWQNVKLLDNYSNSWRKKAKCLVVSVIFCTFALKKGLTSI